MKSITKQAMKTASKSRAEVTIKSLLTLAVSFSLIACSGAFAEGDSAKSKLKKDSSSAKNLAAKANAETAKTENPKALPDSYWKKKLDTQTYNVTRCSATEAPFTGKYWNEHSPGSYVCSNCGEELFDSKDKFESGTGWPSFTKAAGDVETKKDHSLGMQREEVICRHCGAHLGHLFADGPAPTGMRYCINSASLNLKKADPAAKH